jgi:uncharacterized protein YyaL (SSP411 family)
VTPALIQGVLERLRSQPLFTPSVLRELVVERSGHPVAPDDEPHLRAALDWLCRAQDITASEGGGIARGYSLMWDPYFQASGWQPAYPETTGYIIPTLYYAARLLGRRDYAERATSAARWEIDVQLPSGAVQGGVIGQGRGPAIFNTGQVLLGWLAAHAEVGDDAFAAAARRAADFLTSSIDSDGIWRRGNSSYASTATLYNARTAWALAEAGRRLRVPAFSAAAASALYAVAKHQRTNGWIPECCLTDPARPLLHTLAYTVRGLLEGGRVLEDAGLVACAAVAARRLAALVGPDGRMPGRLDQAWMPGARWSCLTGEAQMANIWLRLQEITGESSWLEPVGPVLRFLKSTQNRSSRDPGLRGGIKGSYPVSGEYGRYQTLNWATKFFVDALLRDARRRSPAWREAGPAYDLA